MSTQKLSNVSVSIFRIFLMKTGCSLSRKNAGHEIWVRTDLTRPIVFQTHINPIPEFILKNALKSLEISKKDFWTIINP